MIIHYSKRAVKAINSMDRPTKQRLKAAIEGLPAGDVKHLKGTNGSYRLRVGWLRVVFSYPSSDEILIEKIGPRGDVYKEV